MLSDSIMHQEVYMKLANSKGYLIAHIGQGYYLEQWQPIFVCAICGIQEETMLTIHISKTFPLFCHVHKEEACQNIE